MRTSVAKPGEYAVSVLISVVCGFVVYLAYGALQLAALVSVIAFSCLMAAVILFNLATYRHYDHVGRRGDQEQLHKRRRGEPIKFALKLGEGDMSLLSYCLNLAAREGDHTAELTQAILDLKLVIDSTAPTKD